MLKKTYKFSILTIFLIVLLLIFPQIVNAVDKQTTTSTINGVTVKWSYTLNEANQIENLKCTNPTELTGNITVPNTLEGKTVISLDNEAFKSASNIKSVTISDTIKKIGYKCFQNCTSLTNIDLGSITDISFDVFSGCTSLTSITIPKTLKNGSLTPSLNNTNITNINFEEGLTVIPQKLCANTGITSIKVPSSVTSIGYSAFENCQNLTSVDLGNIKSISFDVFKDCPKLKNITIPKTLIDGSTVDKGIFTGTTNLTSVTFENGLTEIPAGILQKCSGITSVTIPETVTKINCYAFSGTSIKEITIPNSVNDIEYYVFKDCTKLTKVTILDNCTNIGLFTIYPDKDTVFNNHNENLTIYCYEGSKVAEYAIKTKIKYEYLTRPINNNPTEGTNKPQTTGNTTKKDTTGKTNTGDTTIANGKIPQTGVGIGLIVFIIILICGNIFAYYKYHRLKGI